MLLCEFRKLALLCVLSFCVLKVKGACFCKPCGPIPTKKGFQFIGFVRNQDPSHYKLFDFKKLTTLVILEINGHTKDFVCYAHARSVKVTLLSFPATEILWRKKLRDNYTNRLVKLVTDNNLDGVNIDYERYVLKWFNPFSYNGLTSLMRELREKLQSLNPLYELSMDWMSCANCLWGFSYDYNVIKNYIDYFLIMFYDMQWHERDVNNGLCKAKSQNHFSQIQRWTKHWATATGIPRKKLVFAFPWYGYIQPCHDFDHGCETCLTPCDNLNQANQQRCYFTAQSLLRKNRSLSGRRWNDETKSPHITWLKGNLYYQMNYDDPESLKLRYDLAFSLGVKGVAAWHVSCLDYRTTKSAAAGRAAMWAVIPTGKETILD